MDNFKKIKKPLIQTEDGKFRKLVVVAKGRTLMEEIFMRVVSQFVSFIAGSVVLIILLKYIEGIL